jgi:shikimate kinase
MLVFLIGYMASGKSKTGEQLAPLLGAKFVDTDILITEKSGKSIPEIFSIDGEEHFRRLEREVLESLGKKKNLVVSTGGGLPCHSGNMEWMNANGLTVYLDANAGLLFHRLLSSREGRPLLEGLSDVELMEKINSHLAERLPYYQRAKVIFPAASVNVKQLAAKIRQAI